MQVHAHTYYIHTINPHYSNVLFDLITCGFEGLIPNPDKDSKSGTWVIRNVNVCELLCFLIGKILFRLRLKNAIAMI